VDHHTVRRAVARRDAGLAPVEAVPRGRVTDPYADKVVEWIDRSQGRIRADRVHEKLAAMGYRGSERTTRRVVAALKADWTRQHHRSYRPWIPEPGLWLQWDYGDGPVVAGSKVVLWCAWLAWSRFRVILPLPDRTLPSVIAALDRTFRAIGGAPTYALTDNEKTVTERHVARLAVRNPKIVSASVFYGVSIRTCAPADPQSKGGVEATVRIAKADLVPTDANLRSDYRSWAELEEACQATTDRFNGRVHAVTHRRPVDMLAEEREHLHAIPAEPYTVAFGETRAVSWSSTVAFRGARYSVPHTHRSDRVWVRVAGDEVVIVADEPGGPVEIARHPLLGPGGASIIDAHYPPRRDPLDRQPRPTNPGESAFLSIGPGAAAWLIEAAAVGARQIPARMDEAVALTHITEATRVDEALGLAAMTGRFSPGDLESIIAARRDEPRRANGAHSLQPGTARWARLGIPDDGDSNGEAVGR
jgi:hypothetical protein